MYLGILWRFTTECLVLPIVRVQRFNGGKLLHKSCIVCLIRLKEQIFDINEKLKIENIINEEFC